MSSLLLFNGAGGGRVLGNYQRMVLIGSNSCLRCPEFSGNCSQGHEPASGSSTGLDSASFPSLEAVRKETALRLEPRHLWPPGTWPLWPEGAGTLSRRVQGCCALSFRVWSGVSSPGTPCRCFGCDKGSSVVLRLRLAGRTVRTCHVQRTDGRHLSCGTLRARRHWILL